MFSDKDLNLQPRWFTGKEWADGTAERLLIEEYEAAIARKNGKNPPQEVLPLWDRGWYER